MTYKNDTNSAADKALCKLHEPSSAIMADYKLMKIFFL